MAVDQAHATDGLAIGVAAPLNESPKWHAHLRIDKYADDEAYARGETYEVTECDGNLVTTAGWGRITTLLNAGTGNLITSTTARIGAGNSNTAAAIGQTDLQAAAGAANRYFMTSTVTIPSAPVIQAVAVFGTADGNFAWEEWGIDIGTATVTAGTTVNAVLLNRKVASNGTKASGQTWTATATITFS
jgi:hypothetical protein